MNISNEDGAELVKLADALLEQVLPQAGGIVLDIGVCNDLAMLTSRLKREAEPRDSGKVCSGCGADLSQNQGRDQGCASGEDGR